MRKTKTQKGITLVALVITIVALLILAITTVLSIRNGEILVYAEKAKSKYSQTKEEEKNTLGAYENTLSGEDGELEQEGSDEEKVTLTVGTKITNYTAGGKEWRLLGVQNGILLLVSTTNIGEEVGYGANLDTKCASYAQGDFAASARSITVADINRVTGYSPSTAENGNPYGYNTISEYGTSITYNIQPDSQVSYKSNVTGETGNWIPWYNEDGTMLKVSGATTMGITNSAYSYTPSISGAAYSMLFSNGGYWLNSSFQKASSGEATCGWFWINNGKVEARSCHSYRYGGEDVDYADVRPVVVLKSGVSINASGELYFETTEE